MTATIGARVRLVLWSGVLVGVLWFLHGLGAATLGTPPLTSPNTLPGWLEEVGSATAVVAVLRLVAVALSWWLLIVTIIGGFARATRADAVQRVIDPVTPGFVRTLLGPAGAATAIGLALAVGPLVAVSFRTDQAVAPVAADEAPTRPPPRGVAVAQKHESLGPALIARSVGPATIERVTPLEGAGEETWTVETGDHLWSIAGATLADHEGRPVGDDEVDRYWRRVVDANRKQLVDPDNADLIYPGQRIALPPLGPAGAGSDDQAAGA